MICTVETIPDRSGRRPHQRTIGNLGTDPATPAYIISPPRLSPVHPPTTPDFRRSAHSPSFGACTPALMNPWPCRCALVRASWVVFVHIRRTVARSGIVLRPIGKPGCRLPHKDLRRTITPGGQARTLPSSGDPTSSKNPYSLGPSCCGRPNPHRCTISRILPRHTSQRSVHGPMCAIHYGYYSTIYPAQHYLYGNLCR